MENEELREKIEAVIVEIAGCKCDGCKVRYKELADKLYSAILELFPAVMWAEKAAREFEEKDK